MPASPTPLRLIINMADPALAGLLQSKNSTVPTTLPLQTSSQGQPLVLEIVEPTGAASPVWQDVDTTGALFQVSVARPGFPAVAALSGFTRDVDGIAWDGTIAYLTEQMTATFATTNLNTLVFTFQVDVLFAGASSYQTVLQVPVAINRSVIAGGGVPDPVVPGALFTLHAFTDNDTKLAAPGVNAGDYADITGEANRIEQYLGPIAGEAGAGLTVSGLTGYLASKNGVRVLNMAAAPETVYTKPGSGSVVYLLGDGTWQMPGSMGSLIATGTASAYPWDAVWTMAAGVEGTAPIVTRNDVANDANWLVLRNTVNLTVTNDTGIDATINGAFVAADETVNAGWVDPQSFSVSPPGNFMPGGVLSFQTAGGDATYWNLGQNGDAIWYGAGFLLFPLPPRAIVNLAIFNASY